jgi:hypothetical protein
MCRASTHCMLWLVPCVLQAHFCLHTEGNGWGARVVDYMAMECLPLMVNDGMLFAYSNVLNWDTFSIHLSKRQVWDVRGACLPPFSG